MIEKITVSIGIVVILIAITLSGLTILILLTDITPIQERINQRLNEIEMLNNQLVQVCNWDVPRGIAADLCDKQMKEAWSSSCQDSYVRENLSSCSKIESYLQNRDIL